MRGKYTTYSLRLAAMICARIAAGAHWHTLSREPGMPSTATLYRWRNERPEFDAMYEAACLQRDKDETRRRQMPGPPRIGHPPTYTPEIGAKVCALIEAGASVTDLKACKDLPATSTLFRWVARYPEFRRDYEAACEMRAELMCDELIDIADDQSRDWADGGKGERILDREHVQRSKVRIATRQYRIAQLAPKKYGLRRRGAEVEGLTFEEALRELRRRRP